MPTDPSEYPVPDKTTKAGQPDGHKTPVKPGTKEHFPHDTEDVKPPPDSPPPSIFKHLKPSETRYSIVTKDEL